MSGGEEENHDHRLSCRVGVGEIAGFVNTFPPPAPAGRQPELEESSGDQLALSFRGKVYIFDAVHPEQVQDVLLMLGGQELSSGHELLSNATGMAAPSLLNHGGSNDVSQSLKNPQRFASLMRYREKRKNLCFDKKILYNVRSEVASRLKRHKGQFVSSSTSLSPDPTESDCQEENQLLAFCQNCGTSKASTPMMRCGPDGPKSLCNACGLMWASKGALKKPPQVSTTETQGKCHSL